MKMDVCFKFQQGGWEGADLTKGIGFEKWCCGELRRAG